MPVSLTNLNYLEEKATAASAAADSSAAYASGPDSYAAALADNLAAQNAWNKLLKAAAGYMGELTLDEIQNTGLPGLLSKTIARASDHLQLLKSTYKTLQEQAAALEPKPTYQRPPKTTPSVGPVFKLPGLMPPSPTTSPLPPTTIPLFPPGTVPIPAPPLTPPLAPPGTEPGDVMPDGSVVQPDGTLAFPADDGTTALVTGAVAVGAGTLIGWYVAKSVLGGLLGGLGGLGALLVMRRMTESQGVPA